MTSPKDSEATAQLGARARRRLAVAAVALLVLTTVLILRTRHGIHDAPTPIVSPPSPKPAPVPDATDLQPQPPPPAPTPPVGIGIRVMDFGTGQPAPGIELEATDVEGMRVRAWTDERGLADLVVVHRLQDLRPARPDLAVLARDLDQVIGERTLWIHAVRRVHGRVELAGAKDPTGDLGACRVRLVQSEWASPQPKGRSDPWTETWLRAYGMATLPEVAVDATGEFEIAGPVGKAMLVAAHGPGYGIDWVRLEAGDGRDRIGPVRLKLRRTRVATGRVQDEAGRPLAPSSVAAYVHSSPADYQAWNDLQALTSLGRMGFAGGTNARGGFEAVFGVPVDVTGDGRFRVEVPVSAGSLHLVVHVEGRSPVRLAPGERRADDAEEDLGAVTMGPPSTSRIQLKYEGKDLEGGSAVITDVTDTPIQTNVIVSLDPRGGLPAAYLEVGRAYWLIVRGAGLTARWSFDDAILVWRGGGELDLAHQHARYEDVVPPERR